MIQKWEGVGVAGGGGGWGRVGGGGGSGTPLAQVAPLDSYQELIDIGI